MHPFPETKPQIGIQVSIQVANGSTFTGYYDGLQWWVGINDDPNDLPINNEFVTGWQSL